ncbi:RNA-binding protein Rrp4 and related protein [Methanocella conradii HZ254]|uniref:Exosome complex component Rrp4 n=1 Tax=Methanocella conradii (strain DSM 24694 / JCM 17849 / CGMCC 1.5162 / HZ254) TaxID=1041930 RepID=H8IAF4_METCZ|nr:exosome complex RNA-binding protein Rrp4 [Methanocella conradii]AFC99628.1 RNA-binding protein Rrp4 and related protein [Methanocella conradii HZ254]MDI6897469.1 exosome complex RNA-binding protein Rrp4 [Methanocella conradii]
MEREIVVPGDLLGEDPKLAGSGTYVQGGRVYSANYGLVDRRTNIRVIPLSGRYIPARGDLVIGKVVDVTFSNWIIDINSPYEGLLHVSEYPERVDPANMSKCLHVGELIIARVADVDPSMKVELTMRDEHLKVLKQGRVVDISHVKIPRVIGRNGSMISMLKKDLNVSIFVGQNGRIWLKGDEKRVDIAIRAIFKIEHEAHTSGLTDKIKEFISKELEELRNTK